MKKDVFEWLNWALLLSHKVYRGPPPYSYRKAWWNLLTTSLMLHDSVLDVIETKVDAALRAMRDIKANDNLAVVDQLQNLIQVVAAGSNNWISQMDADIVIASTQEIIRSLRGPKV